ncbi:MAG: HIT domain-containing protein [bacterium]|nr:HIT domain-containing protein [bacterium]
MEDYSKYLIKDFAHWSVSVHQNQSYLGRCIVWCKREDALDLADATREEREELFAILGQLREATKRAFQADWFNYAFLGNETRHLHGHFIPRYSSPREFEGVTFTDERWGKNYRTDHNFVTPPAVLEAVKLKLKNELEK